MTAQEGIVSGLADAIDNLASGQGTAAAKAVASAPFKLITGALQGRRFKQAYLDENPNTHPMLNRAVQLATDANFRVAGKGRAADEYRYSGAGSFFDAFKRGALKAQLLSDLRDVKGAPIAKTLPTIAKQVGRVMETISDPLFKYYIPAMKNGAFYDGISTWLRAHPQATDAEATAYARKLSDIIDDRFGEVNQDNIFWNKALKQAAQLATVSYSYEMGTLRSFGGAAADIAKAPSARRAGATGLDAEDELCRRARADDRHARGYRAVFAHREIPGLVARLDRSPDGRRRCDDPPARA